MSTQSNFIKDSYWAVGAQAVSLLTSVIVSFILPKYISIADFGYWQYFLLLASYVGVLHFGFGDGLYHIKENPIEKTTWRPILELYKSRGMDAQNDVGFSYTVLPIPVFGNSIFVIVLQ